MGTTLLEVVTLDDAGEIIAHISATISGLLSAAVGGLDAQIEILFYFMAVDFLTGTYAGIKTEGYISNKCREGLIKKIIIVILVSVCHFMGVVLDFPVIRNAVIIAFAFNEVSSVLENVEKMGYGKLIPEKLRNLLNIAKEQKTNSLKEKLGGKNK